MVAAEPHNVPVKIGLRNPDRAADADHGELPGGDLALERAARNAKLGRGGGEGEQRVRHCAPIPRYTSSSVCYSDTRQICGSL